MSFISFSCLSELLINEEFSLFVHRKNYLEFFNKIKEDITNKDIWDSEGLDENEYWLLNEYKFLVNVLIPVYKHNISITNEFIIENIIPLLEIIFIYEDGSSYYFNSQTRLYIYESDFETTILIFNDFLETFKTRLLLLMQMFSGQLLTTLKKIYTELTEMNLREICFLLKNEHDINFNNHPYEIAYKDKILDLKDGSKRIRTRSDYYTNTISYTYYPDYYSTPLYIKSIFGDDEKTLNHIQKVLGSCINGTSLDYIVLFYGPGTNSKTTLIKNLNVIFDNFQLNLDYSTLRKKDLLLDFSDKRLITLDHIDTKTFNDIEYEITRFLSNRQFNFIAVVDNDSFFKSPKHILKRHALVEFNHVFLSKPKKNNEKKKILTVNVNKNFLFTWLCKGAMKYNYEQMMNINLYVEAFEEEIDMYTSNENLFDPNEEYIYFEEDRKLKEKNQIVYIGAGLLQQKRNYFKVGKTKQEIEKRIKTYQTGRELADRFICLSYFFCYDCDIIESEIKKKLNQMDPNHFNEVYNLNYDVIFSVVKETVDHFNKEHELNM